MTTAWQKAMRRGTSKNRKGAWRRVGGVQTVRPGTREIQVDTGAAIIPVREYPDGQIASGVRTFSVAETTVLRRLFHD